MNSISRSAAGGANDTGGPIRTRAVIGPQPLALQ